MVRMFPGEFLSGFCRATLIMAQLLCMFIDPEMYTRFCLTCATAAFHSYLSPHLALLKSQAALEQHLAEKAAEMQILQEQNDRLRAQASSLQQQLSSLQMAASMPDVGHMRRQQHPVLSTMMCICMSMCFQLAVL